MYMDEIIIKQCCHCKEYLDLKNFSSNKSRHDGLARQCKDCDKEYYNRSREKNKIKRQTEEFKKQKRAYSKKYRQTKKYKESKNKYQRSQKYKKWKKEYRKNRRATDPKYKLSERIGISICDALKGRKMGRKWETLVGYTVDDLKNHLESLWEPWMSWENHGVYKPNGPRTWHIDHVIPQDMFNYTNPEDEEFKLCWSLNNLQPKCSKTNIIKKNHYIG